MKFRTPYNVSPDPGEKNNGVSLTQPNQSLSVVEILTRYANGMPLSVAPKQPIYEVDSNMDVLPDVPDLRMMDKVERAQTVRDLKTEHDEIVSKIKSKKPQEQKPDDKKTDDKSEDKKPQEQKPDDTRKKSSE